MRTITVPLSELRFGHEAVPPINVRAIGRESDIAAMADSILSHGLIQHLSVQKTEEGIFVADGNRRLSAMRALVQRGEFRPDHPVPCEKVDEDVDPLEISLAANVMRQQLHPADEYVAFVELQSEGMTETEISARFGIEPRRVRRILALGSLSPVIIDAWRNDALGRDAIECVRAFTLAPSIAAQEAAFVKLSKTGSLYSHYIVNQFGGGDRVAIRNLNCVGKAAYRAAGGTLVEDLFGDQHVVGDRELLDRLVAERLAGEAARLVEEGWQWAAPEWDLPNGASWNWTRDDRKPAAPKKAVKARRDELRATIEQGAPSDAEIAEYREIERELLLAAYPAEQRAATGVILSIAGNGAITLKPGYSKPQPSKAAATGKKEKSGPAISNAVMHRLSIQLTLAARQAIETEPRLGLVALLAGFLSHAPYGDPVRVSHSGYGRASYSRAEERESYADVLARLTAMDDASLFRVAAGIAGQSLDLQRMDASKPPLADSGIDALLAAIDPPTLGVRLAEAFDADDYFKSVSKPLVLQAIREAGFSEDQAKTSTMKKGDLVAFAVANVPKSGWLPPELRTANYSGSGRAA